MTGESVIFLIDVSGSIARRDATLTYVKGDKTLAVVTLGRDLESLRACARRVKNDVGRDERQVTVTASPNVPYQVIISVMDALRTSEKGEALFPDVNFGVAR